MEKGQYSFRNIFSPAIPTPLSSDATQRVPTALNRQSSQIVSGPVRKGLYFTGRQLSRLMRVLFPPTSDDHKTRPQVYRPALRHFYQA